MQDINETIGSVFKFSLIEMIGVFSSFLILFPLYIPCVVNTYNRTAAVTSTHSAQWYYTSPSTCSCIPALHQSTYIQVLYLLYTSPRTCSCYTCSTPAHTPAGAIPALHQPTHLQVLFLLHTSPCTCRCCTCFTPAHAALKVSLAHFLYILNYNFW